MKNNNNQTNNNDNAVSSTEETLNTRVIITHPGIFHADDVCSVAFLRLLGVTAPVERRVPSAADLEDPTVLVLDIGGRHEPSLLNFDHHQFTHEDWAAGRGARWDGVPYAAFGLLADHFAHANPQVHQRFDERLVQPVDAADCGWGSIEGDRPTLSFSAVITGFNPGPDATPAERIAAFDAAVEVAKQVIANTTAEAEAFVEARDTVSGADTAVGDRVLILEKFVPWSEHLFDRADQHDLLYVVFPSLRGGFCVQQVPEEPDSFKGRKALPEAWAAKRGQELAELLGLSSGGDATFCHGGRFVGGAETLEDCLKMARLAVES